MTVWSNRALPSSSPDPGLSGEPWRPGGHWDPGLTVISQLGSLICGIADLLPVMEAPRLGRIRQRHPQTAAARSQPRRSRGTDTAQTPILGHG